MKKYLLAAAITGLASTASALCQYPLDATSTQYAQVGFTPFPYINLQSVEFTSTLTLTPAGGLSAVLYNASSAAGIQAAIDTGSTGILGGDITLPASGIVALELSMDHFPAYVTDTSNIGFVLEFTTTDLQTFNFALAFETANVPEHYRVVAVGKSQANGVTAQVGAPQIALPQPLPAGFRSGLYLNMDTRQVGYTINGVDYGYVKTTDGTPFTIPVAVQKLALTEVGLNQVFDPSDANLGQVLGATLITDRSQFTQPFPAGATDICGSAGGNVLRLPNGKPYPGNGNPAGLKRVQDMLQQGLIAPPGLVRQR